MNTITVRNKETGALIHHGTIQSGETMKEHLLNAGFAIFYGFNSNDPLIIIINEGKKNAFTVLDTKIDKLSMLWVSKVSY